MAQIYRFSEKEIEEIVQARRENKDKRAEVRSKALEMRARGIKANEIAEATGFHSAYIAQLAAKYTQDGSKHSSRTKSGHDSTHQITNCKFNINIIHYS